MRSPPTPCWRKWEPTGRSFATSMPSLPGPASVPTIKRAEGKFSLPKPAGLPIASIALYGWQPRPWKGALPIWASFIARGAPAWEGLPGPRLPPTNWHASFFTRLPPDTPTTKAFFAAEEQRQRKHLESSLRRKAAKLGYQLIPLPQTAVRGAAGSIEVVHWERSEASAERSRGTLRFAWSLPITISP